METPACSSKLLPDACITIKLETGIKPNLPDPLATFNLEAGIKPKLPDPWAELKLEAAVIKPKLLPDEPCSQLKLEAGGIEPKKLPDVSNIKVKLEAGTDAFLEPKPETFEEDATPMPPPDDWEITPVSGGYPFFPTVFSRSQFQKPFQLMETPASPSCPSKQLPDACTTIKLEYGIKPNLLELEAGIKPKLPDPWAELKLEAAGIKPKLLPDETCSQLTLEAGCIEPKMLPDASTIKVKLEPGTEAFEEDAPPMPPPDDWEITPVSGGHPFFTTVFSRSQVQKPFQLAIPTRFHRHLPEARVPAVLLCRGQSWPTSYCGDLKVKKLDAAWRGFAVDNQLRVGDAGIFELVDTETEGEARSSDKKTVVFRVQVLRGDLPEELTSKGATSDEPLVIVD